MLRTGIKYNVTGLLLILALLISTRLIYYSNNLNSNQEKTDQQGTESEALAAIRFWTDQRAYPNSFIDEKKYSKAFTEHEAARLGSKIEGSSGWEAIGPLNRGGRMLALAFNPQNHRTLYAGSASGGLWRSYTAGEGQKSWHQVQTGHPILGVGAIEFLPGDSSTIFIGTGEVYFYESVTGGIDTRIYRGSYGNGIYRSLDGGLTWARVLDWDYSEKHGVQIIRVNPLRPQTIWAGTSHGIYRSTNGGDSWQLINEIIMVTDIEINPEDTSLMYMACGNLGSTGNGLYRSIDGGNNWNRMTSGLPSNYGGKALLSMSPVYPEIIYAGIGNGYTSTAGTWLCKTTNGGENWTILNDTNYSYYQGWFAHDVAVHPVSPDTVFCFGLYGWRSVDGGESLHQITSISQSTDIHVDFHALLFHPGSTETIYIASDGGVYRTEDLGGSFDRLDNGLQTSQFYNGFSNSHQNAYKSMGGLQDNGTYRFNGAYNWIYESGGDGSWTAIDPINDNILYTSSQYLRIQKSTDNGASFFNIAPPNIGSVSFIAPYVLAPSQPNVIYAGRSYIYKSYNGGITWNVTNNGHELDGNPVLSMAVSHQNQNIVYAGTAPRNGSMNVFLTVDGGASWNNIKGNLPERYPVDMAVNPLNDAVIYIALSGFGSGHLYKSVDYGNNWINISDQLPDVPASAVIVDPFNSDHIFFGNDLGVYYSYNGGEIWETFSDGLPEAVIVKDLSISTVNHKLRVATHGNGAYEIDLPLATSLGKIETLSDKLTVYPNPVNDHLYINYYAFNGQPVNVIIRSLNGMIVYSGTENLIPGNNEFLISGLNFPAGIYLLEVRQGGESRTNKIIKLD